MSTIANARSPLAKPMSHSGPGQLLKAIADFLYEPRYTALASLVRHPAILKWLADNGCDGDCLTPLDRYHVKHLPSRAVNTGSATVNSQIAKAIYQKLSSLLSRLPEKPAD